MSLSESEFIIYRWEDTATMHFVRRLLIKHETGTSCTPAMVAGQVQAEIHDFAPDLYRAVPADRYVDFEVEGQVKLS
jgi:hypothetical protein